MNLQEHFYYHNKPYAELSDKDKAFIDKCVKAIVHDPGYGRIQSDLEMMPAFTIKVDSTETGSLPQAAQDYMFTAMSFILNRRPFDIVYNDTVLTVTPDGGHRYTISPADNFPVTIYNFSKLAGNEIKRWTFIRNEGEDTLADVAQEIGSLIEDALR